VQNTILYGFATGVTHATLNKVCYDDNNNYYNNTSDVSDVTMWRKGPNTIAVDPDFTDVVERSGSTATTTAGNHLVQTGATFQTWNITPGRDYLYLVSGTGVTAGIYGIASVDYNRCDADSKCYGQ
jgi:thiamine biosynthesis lipoprotein ApbE